jgi:hypothetical protein
MQRLLTHQIRHTIIPQHARHERERSRRRFHGFGLVRFPVRGEEVGGGDEGEGELDGKKDADEDEVEGEGANEEEEVEHGPHCSFASALACCLVDTAVSAMGKLGGVLKTKKPRALLYSGVSAPPYEAATPKKGVMMKPKPA